MSQTYTINQNGHKTLERDVAEIEAQVGSIVVAGPDGESMTVAEGDSYEPAPGFVNLVTLTGANVVVTYADEVTPEAAPRGDSGGDDHGGLEARTDKELYAEAQKLDIAGRSKMSKTELIAAIRNAE